MNKRQLKKKDKKRLPVVADEYNLLTMTNEEMEKAHSDYNKFVKKYSYRKKYRDLKGKHLRYFYPMGERASNFIKEVSQRARKYNNPNEKSNMLLQSLNDESSMLSQNLNDFTDCENMVKKIRSTPIKINVCVQTLENIIETKKD